MRHRILLSTVAAVALSGAAASYYWSTAEAKAPQYQTTAVTRGDVVTAVAATGTLEAVTTVQVGSQVSGTIASLHADFNSQVRKGEVIARLDPSLLQSQVDQARASIVRLEFDIERARLTLEDAGVKLRRAKALFEQQLIPALEVENAAMTERLAQASLKAVEAQVEQAKGSLDQNLVNLSHTVIAAPVDGIVISRNVDVGQTVAASMSAPTLFVIARDLSDMQVSASIDEADIGRIAAKQRVTFTVDAYPRETFEGTVSQVRLQPVVQQNVVSYVTIIDVPNPSLKLKPGMTANVTVEVARADDTLRVANAALRFTPPQTTAQSTATSSTPASNIGEPRAQGAGRPERASAASRDGARDGQSAGRVFVLRDGALEMVRVRTGITDGTTTAIDVDLPEGTEVVTGLVAAGAAASPAATSPLLPTRPGSRSGAATGARGQGGAR